MLRAALAWRRAGQASWQALQHAACSSIVTELNAQIIGVKAWGPTGCVSAALNRSWPASLSGAPRLIGGTATQVRRVNKFAHCLVTGRWADSLRHGKTPTHLHAASQAPAVAVGAADALNAQAANPSPATLSPANGHFTCFGHFTAGVPVGSQSCKKGEVRAGGRRGSTGPVPACSLSKCHHAALFHHRLGAEILQLQLLTFIPDATDAS